MNPRYTYSLDDIAYRTGWVKRAFDAAPVLCGICSGEIKGSHDTLQSQSGERRHAKPAHVCAGCMISLQEEMLSRVPDAVETGGVEPKREAADEVRPVCFACTVVIRGTPFNLYDSESGPDAVAWGQCCWPDGKSKCRDWSRQQRQRDLAAIEAQAQQDGARYGV